MNNVATVKGQLNAQGKLNAQGGLATSQASVLGVLNAGTINASVGIAAKKCACQGFGALTGASTQQSPTTTPAA